ncbi:MAG: hypothetical protein ACI93R_002077 [Flavobacteriales bacterium]|jgi:hypothetical protein
MKIHLKRLIVLFVLLQAIAVSADIHQLHARNNVHSTQAEDNAKLKENIDVGLVAALGALAALAALAALGVKANSVTNQTTADQFRYIAEATSSQSSTVHHTRSEHLTHEHNDDEHDCHCCHCHHSPNSALLKTAFFALCYQEHQQLSLYRSHSSSAPSIPLYRPPKV